MLRPLLILAVAATSTLASFDNNLVYRSPYSNRPDLAHDTHRVRKRQQSAQGRGVEQVRPAGKSDNYEGYGNAVVDWSRSDLVYGGSVNYTHAVASGDPWDRSVLLWTRAIPTNVATRDVPVCLTYHVSDKANMTGNIVSKGMVFSSYDVDNTFKVEAKGLSASTYYWFQFTNCAKLDEKSPIGRTKTAPGADAKEVGKQRFAVYSCSNYPNGFFNSYGGPVENEDVDYVLHLGDYIYEKGDNSTGSKIGRTVLPEKEIFTVEDYRQRYATYRLDPDLQANHLNFPWINIWDDHEGANNIWKAGTDNSNDTAAGCAAGKGVCFTEREANAKRAYHEWIPIREVDISNEKRIWRDFQFGDLLDVVALDTRMYDRDVTDNGYNEAYVAELAVKLNTTRSITGDDQEEWLLKTIDRSLEKGTKWRLIMNQVIMGSIAQAYSSPNPDEAEFRLNYDAWDGYQAQRKRIFDHAYEKKWDNSIVITGDTHINWLFENNKDNILVGTDDFSTLKVANSSDDYVRGQLVEFGGTAVSSSGWGAQYLNEANATSIAARALVRESPGLLWTEGFYRGYMTLECVYRPASRLNKLIMAYRFDSDKVTTSYWAYPQNEQERKQDRTLSARFVIRDGTNSVQRPLNSTFGAIKGGA